MITNWFLDAVSAFLDWVISVRPSWVLHLPSGVNGVVGQMKSLNAILPMSEIFSIIKWSVLLVGSITLWKWTIKLADWVADVIP